MKYSGWTKVFTALAILAVLILPFLIKDYKVFQFTMTIIYAIAILGLNLLTGFNGQFSLGHGAFFALGAYVAALLMTHLGMPYWATLPFAFVASFIVGLAVGFPALRLAGPFLALATLGLAVSLPQLLKYKGLEDYTGGNSGLFIMKPGAPFEFSVMGVPLSPDRWLYYVTLVVAVVVFVLVRNLLNGRSGRAIVAIRDHPIAAASMGINLPLEKTLVFGISSGITGVAGALSAIVVSYIAPDSFSVMLSIFLLVGAVVGGLTSVSGAIIGGLFIQFIPNFADHISKAAPSALYGVMLIILMYVLPNGAIDGVRQSYRYFRRKFLGRDANPRDGTKVAGRGEP